MDALILLGGALWVVGTLGVLAVAEYNARADLKRRKRERQGERR